MTESEVVTGHRPLREHSPGTVSSEPPRSTGNGSILDRAEERARINQGRRDVRSDIDELCRLARDPSICSGVFCQLLLHLDICPILGPCSCSRMHHRPIVELGGNRAVVGSRYRGDTCGA